MRIPALAVVDPFTIPTCLVPIARCTPTAAQDRCSIAATIIMIINDLNYPRINEVTTDLEASQARLATHAL